jgi:hypothetical protein
MAAGVASDNAHGHVTTNTATATINAWPGLVGHQYSADKAANTTTPLMLGPKEFGDYQRREIDRFRKVAEQAGLQPK